MIARLQSLSQVALWMRNSKYSAVRPFEKSLCVLPKWVLQKKFALRRNFKLSTSLKWPNGDLLFFLFQIVQANLCAELDRASKLFQGCESAVRPTKMYIGNAPKTEVRLNSMPWFHGKIKREEAESLLTPREVGDMLDFKLGNRLES